MKYLGRFQSEVAVAHAYDAAAVALFGEYARNNFEIIDITLPKKGVK
jgi:hypothetical protein